MEEYQHYLEKIWHSHQLTNNGPLLKEFESSAKTYLGVDNFHFVTNGTLALQLALRSLGETGGEIITTPFSYVATVSSILWEGFEPVFVDIEPNSLCIDPGKIEAAITDRTKAILPVHVFGNPCDVEAIEVIGKKHGVKVIYDGAHAFGVKYKNRPLLSYGDISICSFHATKPFHTIEGGAVIAKDKEIHETVELQKRFGHTGDEHFMLGINAKASEFQAAMGLCNLDHIEEIIAGRRNVSELYDKLLGERFQRPKIRAETRYNYAYHPILFKNEAELLKVFSALNEKNVFPRRYFYPSLNTLPYIKKSNKCKISKEVTKRIACLPLYAGLKEETVREICTIIKSYA